MNNPAQASDSPDIHRRDSLGKNPRGNPVQPQNKGGLSNIFNEKYSIAA
jgi:hypothetical protein